MQAIVSEAVNLEGLVQQLRNSIQEHFQRVMASEAAAPYVTTGPLCDFATQWSPEIYMVRKVWVQNWRLSIAKRMFVAWCGSRFEVVLSS
jgi:hypothetical protein